MFRIFRSAGRATFCVSCLAEQPELVSTHHGSRKTLFKYDFLPPHFIQCNHGMQAQYFRDPDQLPRYLASNKFLTDINNEITASVNDTYAYNLASLNNLVLVLFAQDRTVVPKESAWFGSYAPSDETDGVLAHLYEPVKTLIPMRLQPLYVDDLIGLRTLDESGRIVLESCEGEHMEIRDECWRPLVKRFVGGEL